MTSRDVKALMAEINRDFGDGTIMLGSEVLEFIPRIPSPSLSLDVALGGGWPANQWNEIIGNESVGKTVLALMTVAENQRRDPDWVCLWIDAEHSFDKEWWTALGVDTERVLLVSTNIMEEAYEIATTLAKSRQVDGIVIDSLPALSPASEDEKTIAEMTVGLGALLTNKFFRKQNHAARRSLTQEDRPVTGWLVNQWREKIGVMYGDNRTTPGGRGKNFACFTRVEVSRDDWIKDGKDPVGLTIKVRNVKNKSARPGRIAVFDFYFAEFGDHTKGSIDRQKDIVNVAIEFEVLRKQGNTYYLDDERVGVGRPGAMAAMLDQPEMAAEISSRVLTMLAKPSTERAAPAPEPVQPRRVVRKKA